MTMYTEPVYGVWGFLTSTLHFGVDAAFGAFLLALALTVIWQVRGHSSLSGLRWGAAAVAVWTIVDLLALVAWSLTGAMDLSYTVSGWTGYGPVALFNTTLGGLGTAFDAVCLAVVVLGTIHTARRLAALTAEVAPARAADESTDPHVGLSVVAR